MKCQGYEIRFLSVQQIRLEMKAFRLKQGQGLKTSAAKFSLACFPKTINSRRWVFLDPPVDPTSM